MGEVVMLDPFVDPGYEVIQEYPPGRSFQWEGLNRLCNDGLPAMIERHWNEVGVHKDDMPLSVDWDRYEQMEKMGILWLMSARIDGKLMGYSSWFVIPHMHYSTTLHALNDAVYVDREVRGLGVRLIKEAEKGLADVARRKGHSLVRVVYHIKDAIYADRGTVGPVMERLGYSPQEKNYDKILRVT